ncbi:MULTISPECIES: hypothetical protein [unclassified Rhizobacter]|uniref:hypothetical protein n=1 Tax=unclassified Rhizobacter TaxID=2640088 RepID=UPI0012FC498F|nr:MULTISPECIES: hypothetical protein [unclassified Rhizobacter]
MWRIAQRERISAEEAKAPLFLVEFNLNISDIKKARDSRDYERALAGCEDMLSSGDNPDVLRLRASIHFLAGSGQSSFDDYKLLISWGANEVKDFFLAANSALFINEYALACEWLESVLEAGGRTGNHAFDNAALLMLAFAKMNIHAYGEAWGLVLKLEASSPNISLPVPHNGQTPMLTLSDLRSEIRRRHQ